MSSCSFSSLFFIIHFLSIKLHYASTHLTSPLVQFNLLHSKFHLCSVPTRALLLSAYIKFINLFPETKSTIQEVLRSDSQIRNSDVELQQRAVEYLKLSSIASTDVLVRSDPFAQIWLICLTPFICLHNITVCNCVGHSAWGDASIPRERVVHPGQAEKEERTRSRVCEWTRGGKERGRTQWRGGERRRQLRHCCI